MQSDSPISRSVSHSFSNLGLIEPLLRSLATEGYSVATPVQAQAIPPALEGRDVLGCAQTGTGKTAAFALPILQRLHGKARGEKPQARCLVLCPTRELATQIADGFRAYGKNLSLRHVVIFGGVNQTPQVKLLRHGVDIIIATPGRLLDLMEQGYVDLRGIEVLVLDEADRMLDMGFINDIRKVVAKLPPKRQTMLFSATMPTEIRQLIGSLLRSPAVIQIAPVATTADGIDESVYFVEKGNKPQLLAHLVNELPMSRAIVFTRTKHGADKVVRHLHVRGIRSEAIHGNKSQNARQRALDNFKAGKIPVLIATDIASRGIDIDNVSHVVNYDLTHEPEVYVHRIGRTARAGATGVAVSFCDRDEIANLKAIEKLIRRQITVREDHPTYEAKQMKAQPVALTRTQQQHDRHERHAPAAQQRHPQQHPQKHPQKHPPKQHHQPHQDRPAQPRPQHPRHAPAGGHRAGGGGGHGNRPRPHGHVNSHRGPARPRRAGRRGGF